MQSKRSSDLTKRNTKTQEDKMYCIKCDAKFKKKFARQDSHGNIRCPRCGNIVLIDSVGEEINKEEVKDNGK